MENAEKTVKIYDVNKKFLGNGQLLSMSTGFIKIKGYDLPILNSKTNVIIEVYNEFHGIFPYFCEVSLASQNQLNALIIRNEPVIERRRSLKVRTDLSFYIESFQRFNEERKKDFPNMKINMINLSIGGMLISCNYDLMVNDIFTFNFQYSNYQIITLEVKVVRIDKIKDLKSNDISVINYGCVFKKLSSYDEAVITKYLYDRQLQLYRNR